MRTGGRFFLLPLVLVVGVGPVAVAGELAVTLRFPEPTLVQADGTVRLEFPETWTYGDPGQPEVPWRGVTVLLPPGEEIKAVDAVPGRRRVLEGRLTLRPGQPQYPLSFEGPVRPVEPDPVLYGSHRTFPSSPIGPFTTQFLSGHGIGEIAVCPVEYVSSEGALSYFETLDLRVVTEPTVRARRAMAERLRRRPADEARLARLVRNPSASSEYPPAASSLNVRSRGIVNPGDEFPYVIVTNAALEPSFRPLADFKSARGIRAAIVLLSDIYAEYAGADDPTRIRAFITDAYLGWGTEYVLLGGDDEIIPHRGLYATAYGTEDDDIAADLYYGALDGGWNADGDAYWGEEGEEDLIPEVHVGRAPVDGPVQAQNFVSKTLLYQQQPVLADCNRAIMMGELLWDEPTWGGDYKDEVLYGSSANGYTTSGFPGSAFEVSTLYDRDLGTWSKTAAIDSLNAGTNLCNHLGHASVTYALRMLNDDVDTCFTNNGVDRGFFVLYTQGCYCNSFDNRTEYGTYTMDAIGERFVAIEEGAVAFVGNTRYGWGQHQGTNGSSQYFDRQFFDAILGERITRIGETHDDAKVDNIPFVTYGGNRWCYYDLCLLGDPELDIWTAVPSNLAVDHPPSAPTGPSVFVVSVSAAKAPVEGARVCLMKEGDVYEVGFTDGTGGATFEPVPQTPGPMTVTVTQHDFLPYSASVDVSGDPLPLPPTGLAAAAGDGEVMLSWDPNPEPDLDRYVILRSTVPDPVDSLASVPAPLTEWLDGGVVNDTTYHYRIQAVDAEGQKSGYSDPVEATPSVPVWIEIAHTPLTDTEQAGVPYPVAATVTTLAAPLNPDSIFVVWSAGARAWAWVPMTPTGAPDEYGGDIPPQSCGAGIAYYVFAADSAHHRATDPGGAPGVAHSFSVDFAVVFDDDFETDKGWTVGAPGDSATLGLWERGDPDGTGAQPEDDHTPSPGVLAYVTECEGGINPGVFDVDGGRTTLLSPVFDLSGYASAAVSYHRWYSNDTGAAPGLDFWVVEITDDGFEWVALENTNQSDRSWVRMEFDLETYVDLTDAVQFRFLAEDAGFGSIVEAAVDDFRITVCNACADTEPPTVSLWDPNGGEQIYGGTEDPYLVQWVSHDNVGIASTEIVLSTDGGQTWPQTLAAGRLESPWPWTVPEVNESACRIKVICRDGAMNEGGDMSDGDFEIVGMLEVEGLGSSSPELALRQNRPNPFNPATEIEFALPSRQHISLEIYSVDGRRVGVLADGLYPAGEHRVVWTGVDAAGREVSTGVYVCRLVTEERVLVRKLIMLK